MAEEILNYKGYQIVPKPASEDGELWYGGYQIVKNGAVISSRTKIYPASLYFKAACTDSIENAKEEIDNLTPKASNAIAGRP